MQTIALQETGDGRQECGRMFFGRKEEGERCADNSFAGEGRREYAHKEAESRQRNSPFPALLKLESTARHP